MNNYKDSFIHYLKYIDPKGELTVKSYENDLVRYVSWLNEEGITDCQAIDYNVITRYIQNLSQNYEYRSIEHAVVVLRQFHRYLLNTGVTQDDPSSFIALKNQGTRLPKVVSDATIRQLISFDRVSGKDAMDYAIILLLYRCGLRVSECVNLTFSNLYREESWLRIRGKGQKERMVPIAKDALRALNVYTETVRAQWVRYPTDRIFINAKGNEISRQYIDYMLKSRCKEMGIGESISAHTLRHSFATTILDTGVDLRIIQELLGHEDISTTQIYTHVSNESLKHEYDQFLKGGFSNQGGHKDE